MNTGSDTTPTPASTADRSLTPSRVIVTDLDLPIGSMVVLFLKIAIAAVPALLFITFALWSVVIFALALMRS